MSFPRGRCEALQRSGFLQTCYRVRADPIEIPKPIIFVCCQVGFESETTSDWSAFGWTKIFPSGSVSVAFGEPGFERPVGFDLSCLRFNRVGSGRRGRFH